MRYDIFREKKGIHIKLDKETHGKLRAKMFLHGLSMQETFEAFARLVADGEPRAIKMLQNFVNKKIRAELEQLSTKVKEPQPLSELDSESLYNLINEDAEKISAGSGVDVEE